MNMLAIKLLVDSDLVLEALIRRGKFYEKAKLIWKIAKDSKFNLYITPEGLKKIASYCSLRYDSSQVENVNRVIQDHFIIYEVDKELWDKARIDVIVDFESAIEVAYALRHECHAIVSENPQSFEPVSNNIKILGISEIENFHLKTTKEDKNLWIDLIRRRLAFIIQQNTDYIVEKQKQSQKITQFPEYTSNIKSLRERQNYSPDQLAALIGVTDQKIEAWEKGRKLDDILIQFFELARALGCKVDDLIKIDPKLKSSIESRIEDYFIQQSRYKHDQLAAFIRVTPDILQAWKNSQQLEELRKYFELAKALECKVSELIDYNNNQENHPSKNLNQSIEEENNDISGEDENGEIAQG